MITPQQIKIIAGVLLVLLLVSTSYLKGVSDTENKYKLEEANAQIELSNKIDKVEKLSNDIADLVKTSSDTSNQKLDSIYKASKAKKLTSVPCTPTPDFVNTWNALNKETK